MLLAAAMTLAATAQPEGAQSGAVRDTVGMFAEYCLGPVAVIPADAKQVPFKTVPGWRDYPGVDRKELVEAFLLPGDKAAFLVRFQLEKRDRQPVNESCSIVFPAEQALAVYPALIQALGAGMDEFNLVTSRTRGPLVSNTAAAVGYMRDGMPVPRVPVRGNVVPVDGGNFVLLSTDMRRQIAFYPVEGRHRAITVQHISKYAANF